MKKNKIIICICARKVNQNLFKLLQDIYSNKNKKYKLTVLIVFNQSSKIKKSTILKMFKILKEIKFFVIYENKIGVSHARNKVLEYLKKKNYDFINFIDDDCRIKPNYIYKHYTLIKFLKIPIITGPQIYDSNLIRFSVFERYFKNLTKVKWASTNNVFFIKKIIKKNSNFSTNVTKYGFGEDQLFFSQLSNQGEIIKWHHNPVYESVNAEKRKVSWFIKRNFYYGLTGVMIDRELYNKFHLIVNYLIKIVFYFCKFIIYSLMIPINPKKNFYLAVAFFLRLIGRMYSIKNL